MQNVVIQIKTEHVYHLAIKQMESLCGLNRDNNAARKSRAKAEDVWQNIFVGTDVDVLLVPFTRENVRDESLVFDDTEIPCDFVTKQAKEIIGGYAFMLHAPTIDLAAFPVSRQYYIDSWQTCIVDSSAQHLRKLLLEHEERESGDEISISQLIAPGLGGIPGSSVGQFFEFMNHERIGMELTKSGMMIPVKSFVGVYLFLMRNGKENQK